jgi:hypothetical protein
MVADPALGGTPLVGSISSVLQTRCRRSRDISLSGSPHSVEEKSVGTPCSPDQETL